VSNSPQVAPVTEKTIRTRVVPAAELHREKTGSMPDFWEYIESLSPDQWSDHIAYLYRQEPKATTFPGAPPAYLDKYTGTIDIRPGVTVAMDDAGTVQEAIKEKFGGRVFRIILKKGKERITEVTFSTEALPRYPDTNSQYAHNPTIVTQTPSDSNAAIASKAIDAVTGQQPEALRLAMDVLKNASDIVMRQTPPPAPVSILDQTIMQALIAKALAPPPDPFAMFLQFKELVAPPASNGVKETLDLITTLKNSNLIGGAAGKSTLLDLGREVIPAIATTARDAIHEWRLGVEAQVRGVEISRGNNPPPPTVLQPPPAIEPAAAPAPSPPAQTAPSGEPPFDWLAIKIVEILRDQSYTVDEAVDEALSFLYRAHAPAVPLLLDPPKLNSMLPPGEQGLLMLFQNHPVLKQVPVNPRLVEFIRKFIAAAKEAETESAAPTTTPPAAPAPA
jgi:hypothetical protein